MSASVAASEQPAFATVAGVRQALAALPAPDATAIAAARARQAQLTKPAGALGRLEEIGIFLAGWQRTARPQAEQVRAAVFAGNHGVAALGVSAYPADVTAAMVRNFENGGAAINVLARANGIELQVLALDLDRPTADFTRAPALTEAECLAAMAQGAATVTPGLQLLLPGEMGIGNSTAAAAICARLLGGGGARWAGPGTGLDPAGVARKAAIIDAGLARHADAPASGLETLRRLGGREIAAIAGAILQARLLRVPVLVDGFICTAALLALAAEAPAIAEHCLAGHCSAEPGHGELLQHLGLQPILQLGLRLGEASGAAAAVPIVRAAARVQSEMASFAEAGVPQP